MRVLISIANPFIPSRPFPSRSPTIPAHLGHVLQVPTPSKISPKHHPRCHIVCFYLTTLFNQTQTMVQQTQTVVNQTPALAKQTQGSLTFPRRQGSSPVYIQRRCLASEPLRGALVDLSTHIDTHTRPMVIRLLSLHRPRRPMSLL